MRRCSLGFSIDNSLDHPGLFRRRIHRRHALQGSQFLQVCLSDWPVHFVHALVSAFGGEGPRRGPPVNRARRTMPARKRPPARM